MRKVGRTLGDMLEPALIALACPAENATIDDRSQQLADGLRSKRNPAHRDQRPEISLMSRSFCNPPPCTSGPLPSIVDLEKNDHRGMRPPSSIVDIYWIEGGV